MARTRMHHDSTTAHGAAATGDPAQGGLAAGVYLDGALQASQVMLRGMAAIQSEVLEFAGTRLREGLQASGSLLECRGDARQAIGLQLDFTRRATEQYLEETSRLMGIAAQMARDCWARPEASDHESAGRASETRPTEPQATA